MQEIRINLPVSKSIGARYLTASYFAGTLADTPHFEDSDDLKVIRAALETLAAAPKGDGGTPTRIDVGASGTAFRFMAAVIASTPGSDCILTGTERLCSRPMGPLIDVLQRAGASVEPLGEAAKGPFRIMGDALEGGEFEIAGDISSQFISALMLAAPTWKKGMTLRFTTRLTSRPYVNMTAEIMRRSGIAVELERDYVRVSGGTYAVPSDFKVEADWSAASYFYEAACHIDTPLLLVGLTPPSETLQGDCKVAEIMHALGAESTYLPEGVRVCRRHSKITGIGWNLEDTPDLLPALAVTGCLQSVKYFFFGLKNLRVKECDRLRVMQGGLEYMGYAVNVGYDNLEWKGETCSLWDWPIDPHDDHRIAMAFAVAALWGREVRISHPEVVSKSFPGFWDELRKLGVEHRREGEMWIVECSDRQQP